MIDSNGLGVDGVIVAAVGVVVAVLVTGLLIGLVAGRLAGCRPPIAIGFGMSCAVALVVDAVVVARTLSGEVTVWDVIWACGLTTAALSLWRLANRSRRPGRHRSEPSSPPVRR